jgi:hypothetical protein
METVLSKRDTWTLPPLILHPFADEGGPGKLVQSSRASLILQGLLPSGEASQDELNRSVLEGRYCEIRMLFYVGKDLRRWIEQCLEFVEHEPELRDSEIKFRSFANLLVRNAPAAVQQKLRRWGVADYKSIFSRALGLSALFSEVPTLDVLSEEFIRDYYRYSDQLFAGLVQGPCTELDPSEFHFELYASGEYSRMLERQWEGRE